MQELSPEVLDSLADAIARRLAERWNLSKHVEPSRPELVDVYALSESVGLSVPTINRALAAGTIPSVQAGRRRLFVVADVVAAIREAGEHLTTKPADDPSPTSNACGARS